jgi:ABC-type nitrate/sulfonate/bicarbonate transport system substrate-binding protein
MKTALRFGALALTALASLSTLISGANAETAQLRIARQYGLAFLPMVVMQAQKFYDQRAAELGIQTKAEIVTMGNNTAVNEALISGSVDIVTNGPPGFLTVWSRTKGSSNEVKGIVAMVSQSSWLNTRDPNIKSIKDFKSSDRIALSAIKVSIPAIILQMAAAKEWGMSDYARLDPLTVSLPHPDGMSMLVSGKSEISSHFTAPPFQNMEVKTAGVHTILTSEQVMGGPSNWSVLFTSTNFKTQNPKAIQAFVRALDDSIKFIKAHPSEAADIYLAGSKEGGVTKQEVLDILGNGSIDYTLVPQKIMTYAKFMHGVGTLKVMPASWKEPFFPDYVQDLPGD